MAMNHTQQISLLIAKAKKLHALEDFLLFLAAEDGMLELCRKLANEEDPDLSAAFRAACSSNLINHSQLLAKLLEVDRSLNQSFSDNLDSYEILGLDGSATITEAKKAFRKLSKQYHPDHSGRPGDVEKFLKIQKAYKKISQRTSEPKWQGSSPWQESTPTQNHSPFKNNRTFLYGTFVLLICLVFFSIFLASKNQSRALQKRSTVRQSYLDKQEQSANPQVTLSDRNDAPSPTFLNVEKINDHLPPAPLSIERGEAEAPSETSHLQGRVPPDPQLLAALKEPFPLPSGIAPGQEMTVDSGSDANRQQIRPVSKTRHKAEMNLTPKAEQRQKPEKKPVSPAAEPGVVKSPPITPSSRFTAVQDNKNKMIHNKPPGHPPERENMSITSPIDAAATRAVERESVTEQLPVSEIASRGKDIPPAPSRNFTQTLRIGKFLDAFTATYTAGVLQKHMSHFTENALENGRPIKSFYKNYQTLFQKTKLIEMKIYNYQWRSSADGFKVHAPFSVSYFYMTGERKNYTGEVSFNLVDSEDGHFKISRLTYSIDD